MICFKWIDVLSSMKLGSAPKLGNELVLDSKCSNVLIYIPLGSCNSFDVVLAIQFSLKSLDALCP